MCLQEAAQVANIRERAKIALKNADIRKRKARLHERIAGLDALAKKGKVSKAMLEQRREQACSAHKAPACWGWHAQVLNCSSPGTYA